MRKRTEIAAILDRGNHRCAWCDCALTNARVADRPTVCQLDLFGEDLSMVASCLACAAEFAKWWPYARAFTTDNAMTILGRHDITGSGPFVDYLVNATGNDDALREALERIEQQRNEPLIRRKGRAA